MSRQFCNGIFFLNLTECLYACILYLFELLTTISLIKPHVVFFAYLSCYHFCSIRLIVAVHAFATGERSFLITTIISRMHQEFSSSPGTGKWLTEGCGQINKIMHNIKPHKMYYLWIHSKSALALTAYWLYHGAYLWGGWQKRGLGK